MKSPLPVMTALAYAMGEQARLARAILDREPVKPAPDCIVVHDARYPLPAERYVVCIGAQSTRFATLDEAQGFAANVLAARTDSVKAIYEYLASVSGRRAA